MLTPIQQKYYAWDISHKKSVTDDSRFTGVLSEARVDLNPHQVEAALFAFKSPLSKGAILADEVGLGKTIEAGIILSEMWAENKRDILIVVPASLRNQWNIELMEKFYLPSFILDKNSFQEGAELHKRGEKTIYICSYNFAVTYHENLKSIDWDLIVMDEAHKLRNVYKKSNVMANIIRATFRNYKKVLLTATPLQNNLKELYGLISIIDPEYFSSLDTFAEQYNAISTRDKAKYGELKGRISHIIHRTLRNQVQEYVNFTKRTAFVQEYTPSAKETELYELVTEYLHREGTYGVPEKQRPLLTLLVTKILSSSSYALSFTLDRFIERLKMYKDTGKMTSILDNLNEDNEGSYVDDYPSEENVYDFKSCDDIDDEIRELIGYRNLAQSISKESKAIQLLKALTISFERIENLGGNRKALIFTESRRTQEYLFNFLENNGYKDKVVCVVGGGNTALEDALYLSNIASLVYLIHRRDKFRGDSKYVEEVKSKSNIEIILNASLNSLNGDSSVSSIDLLVDGNIKTLSVDGVFVAIGQIPNSDFLKNIIDLDDNGYINSSDCHTNIKGIYVAGDVRSKNVRQLTTAVSDGTISATLAVNEMEE